MQECKENGLSEQLENNLRIDDSGEQKPAKLSKAQKRRVSTPGPQFHLSLW